jgi:hypothetical protein
VEAAGFDSLGLDVPLPRSDEGFGLSDEDFEPSALVVESDLPSLDAGVVPSDFLASPFEAEEETRESVL